MGMKRIDDIRRRVAFGLNNELVRIRSYVSCTEGNQEAVDKLTGKEFELLLALMVDTVMGAMGEQLETPAGSPHSPSRRAAAKKRAPRSRLKNLPALA